MRIKYTFICISFVVLVYSKALKNQNNIRTLLNGRHVVYKNIRLKINFFKIATFHCITSNQSYSFLTWIIPEPSFPSQGSQARGTRLSFYMHSNTSPPCRNPPYLFFLFYGLFAGVQP